MRLRTANEQRSLARCGGVQSLDRELFMIPLLSTPFIDLAAAVTTRAMLPPPLMQRVRKAKTRHGLMASRTVESAEVNCEPPLPPNCVTYYQIKVQGFSGHHPEGGNYDPHWRHAIHMQRLRHSAARVVRPPHSTSCARRWI